MRQKESRIKEAILNYLNLKGWLCIPQRSVGIWKKKNGSYIPLKQKGVADIICIAPFRDFGLPVAIEVKTERGRLTENQKSFLERWQKIGGIAKLARDLDDIIELENQLGQKRASGPLKE